MHIHQIGAPQEVLLQEIPPPPQSPPLPLLPCSSDPYLFFLDFKIVEFHEFFLDLIFERFRDFWGFKILKIAEFCKILQNTKGMLWSTGARPPRGRPRCYRCLFSGQSSGEDLWLTLGCCAACQKWTSVKNWVWMVKRLQLWHNDSTVWHCVVRTWRPRDLEFWFEHFLCIFSEITKIHHWQDA